MTYNTRTVHRGKSPFVYHIGKNTNLNDIKVRVTLEQLRPPLNNHHQNHHHRHRHHHHHPSSSTSQGILVHVDGHVDRGKRKRNDFDFDNVPMNIHTTPKRANINFRKRAIEARLKWQSKVNGPMDIARREWNLQWQRQISLEPPLDESSATRSTSHDSFPPQTIFAFSGTRARSILRGIFRNLQARLGNTGDSCDHAGATTTSTRTNMRTCRSTRTSDRELQNIDPSTRIHEIPKNSQFNTSCTPEDSPGYTQMDNSTHVTMVPSNIRTIDHTMGMGSWGMHIYTRVDNDFYIPPPEYNVDDDHHRDDGHIKKKKSTTMMMMTTPLARAVRNLPAHNLHSADGQDTYTESSVLAIHDRISRDDFCQTMYIMAAVDCNVEEMIKTDSLDGMEKCFHEQILGRIRLHVRDGLMEVWPGFSIEETRGQGVMAQQHFDGDSEIFVSPEHLETMMKGKSTSDDDNVGIGVGTKDFISDENDVSNSKTKFTFTTPQGSSYRYTLDWEGLITNDWNMMEDLSLRQVDSEYEKLAKRRDIARTKLKDLGVLDRPSCMNDMMMSPSPFIVPPDQRWGLSSQEYPQHQEELLQIEIVSADDFHFVYAGLGGFNPSSIFVRYQVKASGGWAVVDNDDVNQFRRRKLDQKDDPILGQTPAVKRLQTNQDDYLIVGILPMFIITCAILAYGFQLNLTLFGFYLVLLMILIDEVSGGQYDESLAMGDKVNGIPRYFLGHHLSMSRTTSNSSRQYADAKNDDDCKENSMREQFLSISVQVCARYSDSVESILGVGTAQVSIRKGAQNIIIPTCRIISWKGMSERMFRLKDYFIGFTREEIQQLYEEAHVGGFGCMTESTGSVRMTIEHISSNDVFRINRQDTENTNSILSSIPVRREPIEEILSRVRRRRRERSNKEEVNEAISH